MSDQLPAYPFFTRYGEGQYYGYFSKMTTVYVNTPGDGFYPKAEIFWQRNSSIYDGPTFHNADGSVREVLVSREEFTAAYDKAAVFIGDAAREFLKPVPVVYATSSQIGIIHAMLADPALDSAARTRVLRRLPKLTQADAAELAVELADTIVDGLFKPANTDLPYQMVGEAFHVKAA